MIQRILLVIALIASSVAGQTDPVTAYAGKYAGHPRYPEVFGDLKAVRDRALRRVQRVYGLSPVKARRIVVSLVDAADPAAEKIVRFRGAPFQTRTVKEGDHFHVTVRLHTEFIWRGWYDLEEEVIHETVHAVMRERMDRRAYGRIPKWLREGLALWAARQGSTRVRRILASLGSRELEALFPGLERGEHDLNRYAEDWLAIDYLVAERGEAVLKDLMRRLVRGAPPHEAVATAYGKSWKEFAFRARNYSLQKARSMRPAGWDDYLALYDLNRKRDWEGVVRASEAFAKAHPESPLRPDVDYWTGKALRLSKRYDAAIARLEAMVKDPGASTYSDEALYQLGTALIRRKRHGEAIVKFERILRDFPDVGFLDRTVWRLADALAAVGRLDEAKRWIARFEASFKKSQVAEQVAELKDSLTTR